MKPMERNRSEGFEMEKILLVEDDPNIRMAAEFALSDAGYSIVACDNGLDGYANALSVDPDLILLDLMLPGMSGHDFLKEFRAQNTLVPIIVLTAYTSEQEKVFCLDLGADDFIDKPFSVNELLARIRANLRRSTLPIQSRAGSLEEFGDMAIDFEQGEVTIKGEPVVLRNREYEILQVLARHRGSLVTRDKLIQTVWKGKAPSTNTVIDVHMHNLRKSLESRSDYRLIATEYGRGFRLQAVPKQEDE